MRLKTKKLYFYSERQTFRHTYFPTFLLILPLFSYLPTHSPPESIQPTTIELGNMTVRIDYKAQNPLVGPRIESPGFSLRKNIRYHPPPNQINIFEKFSRVPILFRRAPTPRLLPHLRPLILQILSHSWAFTLHVTTTGAEKFRLLLLGHTTYIECARADNQPDAQ
jgi:hypothetical protein